jgi:hypothetical protein
MFDRLQESLYRYSGRTRTVDEYDDLIFELPSELIAYIDANELAKVNNDEVILTDKGRYFMKKYLDEPAEMDIDSIPF